MFRGVAPAECSPYPEVLGPRVWSRPYWQRWCGLEVEAEATEAGI